MIGIICAMEKETEAMFSHMENKQDKKLFHMNIHEGIISGKEVVIANSGVGKVNAAISTTLLLSHYDIDILINVGVAGGLLESQNPLDVIIAHRVIQHDFDTSPIDGDDGLGMVIDCDEQLAKKFKKYVDSTTVASWIGDVASGDSFVTLNNHFERIRAYFPSCVCAEMEAGAIAQTAKSFAVPCLIIRTLSDVAPKEGSAMDFMTFVHKASATAAEISAGFLANL